ncbi:MAG: GldG family protein [Clostridia bacterium]|nr:GldG family protein [Clostridia bacterium]
MKINKRKLQYASLSSVFIILFIVAVLIFNMLVGFLTNRFSLSIDLTENSDYSISDATKEALAELDKNITVYVMEREIFFENTDAASLTDSLADKRVNAIDQIEEMIKRYVTASGGKIKYEFVDKNQNPKFYDRFPNAKATNDRADALLIISRDDIDRYATIAANEIIAQTKNGTVYYSTEAELTGAVLYAASEQVSKVATITGHNELEVSLFNAVADDNYFERIDVNLRTEDIPADVNNVVISAPALDFTADEIAKIDRYLTIPGNNIYVFWNPNLGTNLPVLERFLADWGMQIRTSIVLDQQKKFGDAIMCMVHSNTATAAVELNDETFYTCASHPIDIIYEQSGNKRVLPLASTLSSSYERMNAPGMSTTAERQADEKKGPFVIAAVGERAAYSNDGDVNENRVFLFSSHYMAIDRIMDFPVALNQSFFRAMVRYANKNTSTLKVAPKMVAEYDLNIYESQANVFGIILVVIVPIAILAAGIFIFIKRRHK